ncbi:MAG: IS21 family transposase [Polyangiaceae bacterium]
MTVDLKVEAEIRRLYFAEHWKRGTIASELGVHFDTVVRVLGSFGPKAGSPRPEARVLETYIPFVDETLARYPRLVSTRIHDMLVERGYTGSLRTLRRYVLNARPAPKSEVFLRVETLPGEQAQVDWAHVGSLVILGSTRPLWAFVMVLAYSRAMWGELVLDMSAESLRRSLVRASAFFGGSPRQWLFDNPKTVVLERSGDAVRFHPALLDLSARMHVQPALCGVRKPHEKGKVERAIRYLKDRFFAARTFHSVAHGNAQLLDFFDKIAGQRPHPRWPERRVAEVFEEERPRLLSLPSPLPEIDTVVPITADKTAFVKLDTNRYSVPGVYARQTLTLVTDDVTVRLLDGKNEVARHARCWGRHQTLELREHRVAILEEKRNARDLKGRDRLRMEVPEIDALLERWVDAGRNIGSMIGATIKLLDAYGPAILREVTADMVRRGVHDRGAMAILCEQRRRRRSGPAPLAIQLGDHVVERDVIPHDLGGYDE